MFRKLYYSHIKIQVCKYSPIFFLKYTFHWYCDHTSSLNSMKFTWQWSCSKSSLKEVKEPLFCWLIVAIPRSLQFCLMKNEWNQGHIRGGSSQLTPCWQRQVGLWWKFKKKIKSITSSNYPWLFISTDLSLVPLVV